MSTQPEPQTKAGRELLDRQSDPDWMDLDYPPKLAAILAIEAQATAAARAEAARRLLDHYVTAIDCDHDAKTDTVRCSCSVWTGTPQPSVRDAVRQWVGHVLEDAAPRQPEPDFCPHCGGQFSDMSGHIAHAHAAPDTTTEADR